MPNRHLFTDISSSGWRAHMGRINNPGKLAVSWEGSSRDESNRPCPLDMAASFDTIFDPGGYWQPGCSIHPETRDREDICRQSYTEEQDCSKRVVSQSRIFQVVDNIMGPICNLPQQQTPSVCQSSSWSSGPASGHISLSWKGMFAYTFPPWSPQEWGLEDTDCFMILKVPVWPSRQWFPRHFLLLMKEPHKLPSATIFFSSPDQT